MEIENVHLQANDEGELTIEFPKSFSRPKYLDTQVVDLYVEELFKRISKLSNHKIQRIRFVADEPVMRSAITKLLLDYEKVLTDRFIDYLDEAASQTQDDPGYSQGTLSDSSE